MLTRRRRAAFTLIELIVVIVVIAILAALLFPVFAQARARARAARCVSNLRQVGMAIHQYMQDWDSMLPEFNRGGGNPETFVSYRWYGHVMPYLKNRDILHCPADSVQNGLRAVTDDLRSWANHPAVPRLSYGYNFWLQESSEVTVALPADTLLVADATALQCGDARVTIGGKEASCFAYANGIQPGGDFLILFVGRPGQERHGSGSNVAFFDGHVKFVPADQFRKRGRGGASCFEYPLVEPRCQPWH